MSSDEPSDLATRLYAVIYAAKSTEDKHGSIGTQKDNCPRHGRAWLGGRGRVQR